MNSKGSYISLVDLMNVQVSIQPSGAMRGLRVEVSAFYDGKEYIAFREITDKRLFEYQDFISMQNRERVIRQAVSECLEHLCISIQKQLGAFRLGLKKAIQLVDEGHCVPEFTEK